MQTSTFRALVVAAATLTLAGAGAAQGKFVNYEDPQVKPIALADFGGGVRFLAVCNTPDDSLEIYQSDPPYALIQRLPVGLGPVTVKWDGLTQRLYTCNYLGDSVSCVRLGPVLITPSGPPSVRAVLERTSFVGDEPTDIDVVGNSGLVTLHSRAGMAMIALPTLAVVTPFVPLVGPSPLFGATWGVKAPRRALTLPDGRAYVLNTQGGEVRRNSLYNVGLYVSDPLNPPPGQSASIYIVSDVGSTNFNFAIDGVGRRMFVVSQIAKNDLAGVDAVAASPTGFVQTWLQVLDLQPGAPGIRPQLMREQTAGLPVGTATRPVFRSINLNRDYSQAVLAEVPATDALAQATDVVVIEDLPGATLAVAIAAFGSDKVAVLRPDPTQPSGYAFMRIAIPLVNPAAGYTTVGPRGLVYDRDARDPASLTRPGMLFCANRLDNSVAVVNPWSGTVVAQWSLANDPTPRAIRAGRRFLYDATLSSGNHMVSCASCHVDARTDALGWKLGNLDAPGPAIPPQFHDGNGFDQSIMPNWPNDKPIMVTQTLQGLVNSNVEPFDMQFVTSNAPYHWRGDKLTFQDFNEAFVRLLHRTAQLPGADMDLYTEFVDTIHHPPNPEQRKDRVYGGSTGLPNDPNTGSGALLGRKLFHITPMVGPRSCVQCHHLPDGSSNTLTLVEKQFGSINPVPQIHPFETAAIRNVFAREMVLPQGFGSTNLAAPFTIEGPYGLLHAGLFTFVAELSLSINDFVNRTFVPLVLDPTKGAAVTEFVREFDTGTAPVVGLAATVDMLAPANHTAVFQLGEQQAREANCGVAVHVRTGNAQRGYWYDVPSGLYVLEGTAFTFTRPQIEAMGGVPGDVAVVQTTPAGAERRVASVGGTPTVLTGIVPSQLTLLPMVPNTAFVGITDFQGNWDPNHPDPSLRFVWDPGFGPEPISLKSIRTLQTALNGQFGVPPAPLRHEPSRRFRVSGLGIRNGAKLGLELPSSNINDPPQRTVWFDISPTRYTDSLGRTVWESTEELDAMNTMAWLCGGYWAPGVRDVMYGTIPPTSPLNPGTWNHFTVVVQNEDGTTGTASTLQALTVADIR